jgi:hypothetical protein
MFGLITFESADVCNSYIMDFFFLVALRPVFGSWPPLMCFHDHTQIHHTRYDSSGRLTSLSHGSLGDYTQHPEEMDFHAPAKFEHKILASDWPQSYALDRAATGIGISSIYVV